MKEQLLEKIQELFPFYTNYYEIFLQKQKELSQLKKKLEAREDIPDPEEVEELVVGNNVDMILFTQDLQFIYTRLVYYMDLYIEIFQEDLPSEMQELYKTYKAFYPKINFIMKDGNLVEKEEGTLEAKRQEFLNSETYKQLTKTLS